MAPIIPKKEATDIITSEQMQAADKLEEVINTAVKEHYDGGRGPDGLHISVRSFPGERVMRELRKRAKEAGWTLAYHHDQRDGDSLVLK